MSTISMDSRPRRSGASGGALTRLSQGVGAFFAGLSDGLAACRRYEELSLLSDRRLAELQLRREDLARYAMFGERGNR